MLRSIFGYFVGLIVSVVIFLFVLGILIWGRQASIEQHTQKNETFFSPSKQLVASSLRELSELRLQAVDHDPSSLHINLRVPYRIRTESSLKSIDAHLAELARLEHQFGQSEAFDLPSRARRQLDHLGGQILGEYDTEQPSPAALMPLFDALRDSFLQLARVYEVNHRDWLDREREVVRNSTVRALTIGGVLVALMAVFVTGLAKGLRLAMAREVRIRNDLEEAKANLETLALYDNLTGLGNRHQFMSRLEHLTKTGRRAGRCSALMYIDLDHFKRINDSFGHHVGDEVLKIVGARMSEHVREGDTVARIGGDEFTVIAYDIDHAKTAAVIADKLLACIQEPIAAAGHDLIMTASIGITVLPNDGEDRATLMKNADMALYKAKNLGRNAFQFFFEEMNRAAQRQATLERALRAAIRNQQFELHYQPQIALGTGAVECVEALLRWTMDDGTAVSPEQFIPVADSAGLLVEIGAWVLARACSDLAILRARGHDSLRVAVNLSASQFRDPTLITSIESALAAHELPPDALELEITESTLIEDINEAVRTLETLRKTGITVAVDDFGIGYSSLNYLKRLPLDVLKIDRSFVRDIETDGDDRSIVDAIVAVARSMSLAVVAEGIENAWQLEYLKSCPCDLGQGYFYARPVARDDLKLSADGGQSTPNQPRGRGGLQLV